MLENVFSKLKTIPDPVVTVMVKPDLVTIIPDLVTDLLWRIKV